MTRRTLLALLAIGVLLLGGCAAVIGPAPLPVRIPWPGPSARVAAVEIDGGQPLLLASPVFGEVRASRAAVTFDVCVLGGAPLRVDQVRLAASSGSVSLGSVLVDTQQRSASPNLDPGVGARPWRAGAEVSFRDCGAHTSYGTRLVVQVSGQERVGGAVLGLAVRYRDRVGNTYEQVLPANVVLCGVTAGTSCQPRGTGAVQVADGVTRVQHITSGDSVAVRLPALCSLTGAPVEQLTVSSAADLGNTRLDRVEVYDEDPGYGTEERARPAGPDYSAPRVRFPLCPGYRELAPGAPTVIVGPSLPLVPVDPGPSRWVVIQLSRLDDRRGGGWDGVLLRYRERGVTASVVVPVSVVFCGDGSLTCGDD